MELEELMVASTCISNSKSYRSRVNHNQEPHKATGDAEVEKCGGEGRLPRMFFFT
jgi:hypothetical protein